jgi:hypothetical protein
MKLIFLQVGLIFLGLVPLSGNNWGVMLQLARVRGAIFDKNALAHVLRPVFAVATRLRLRRFMRPTGARSLEEIFDSRAALKGSDRMTATTRGRPDPGEHGDLAAPSSFRMPWSASTDACRCSTFHHRIVGTRPDRGISRASWHRKGRSEGQLHRRLAVTLAISAKRFGQTDAQARPRAPLGPVRASPTGSAIYRRGPRAVDVLRQARLA